MSSADIEIAHRKESNTVVEIKKETISFTTVSKKNDIFLNKLNQNGERLKHRKL